VDEVGRNIKDVQELLHIGALPITCNPPIPIAYKAMSAVLPCPLLTNRL
jgi:hypothetical protein